MVTIFTPTYNREKLLKRCYESLIRQTDQTFKWLIVDDGSTDRTEDLIEKWKREGKLEITYIKQKNGGKHVAHNTGVLNCDTELFICLDSDDFLSEEAVECIHLHEKQIMNNANLAGMALLKGDDKGRLMGSHMPKGIQQTSIKALYQKHHFKGELALVFKTEILKQHLFPIFEGEKFVGESVVYDQISRTHNMLLIDEIVYLCEYTLDGYTTNVTALYAKNSKGYIYFLKQNIDFAESTKEKVHAMALYVSESWRIGYKEWFSKSGEKGMIILILPLAFVKYIKVKIKTSLFSLYIRKKKNV